MRRSNRETTEQPATGGEAWRALPARKGGRLPARWRNPIGIIGASIVGFNCLVAVIGSQIWRISPNSAA